MSYPLTNPYVTYIWDWYNRKYIGRNSSFLNQQNLSFFLRRNKWKNNIVFNLLLHLHFLTLNTSNSSNYWLNEINEVCVPWSPLLFFLCSLYYLFPWINHFILPFYLILKLNRPSKSYLYLVVVICFPN